MKSNQEMVRRIEKFSVTQRTSDGFFDGSELLRQWNSVEGNSKREMKKFLDSPSTQEFLTALAIDENERKSPISKMRYGDNQQVTNKLQNTNKKLMKNFAAMKNISIFAVQTVNESHSFRRASGKVAQSKLGIFYARTLRYWRLPIRSYIQVLRGECINCLQRIWQPLSSYKVCL